MKIYIAGKVTGLPQEEVVAKFAKAQQELQDMGYEAINPVEIVKTQAEAFHTTWQKAMKLCIKALLDCEAVLLLPCWQYSVGAQIEQELADNLEIPCFTNIHDFDNRP